MFLCADPIMRLSLAAAALLLALVLNAGKSEPTNTTEAPERVTTP